MEQFPREGTPRYGEPVPEPRRKAGLLVLFAILILIIGVAWGLSRYLALFEEIRTQEDIAARIAENRIRFSNAFSDIAGVTEADIANGFWYTYTDAEGNEHVLYFDPNALAAKNLSDAEVSYLASLVAKSQVTNRSNMRVLSDSELSSNLQFHNLVYSFGTGGTTTIGLEETLESKVRSGTASSDDLLRLSYLYELDGRYTERDALNRENCERFNVRCASDVTLTISGRVVDGRGAPVSGASVAIVSKPEVRAVQTNADGLYSFKTGVKELEKLRIRAVKRNFSDGFANLIVLTSGVKALAVGDIAIESPINIVTVDYAEKTVTGAGNSFAPDGKLIIKTPQSTYEIPSGAIVGKDGKPYTKGPIDVYLYEFTKGNAPESLTNLDTFDQVLGYAGDLMKTFGMPYIQFFTEDGVELDVLKSKPMVLTYKIAEMEALRTNQDQIYEPLTEADMQLLVAASIGEPYKIDREFLINNQLLRFPAFWVFDRRRGVWDNVGVSVLDTEGTIRSIFYTVRDD
ncbi:carboxypeptidase regulatory-like domain-containing protein [Candidatus Parcubacteria bacterium]|nr:MAG: carboxypeptidase regulatory-like domain-containing protein [Candidatus Parcubacteria bacterium]